MADPDLNEEELENDAEDLEEDLNESDDDSESDDDDEHKTVESWMEEEGEGSERTGSDVVPLHAHVKAKKKLRGTINEQKDEIDKLRDENEALKAKDTSGGDPQKLKLPKRPRRDDFDSDDEFEGALDKYEDEKDEIKFNKLSQNQNLNASRIKAKKALDQSVDDHYERAEKLLESSGISEEAFRSADTTLRQTIDSVAPKRGDIIADQMISILGEGSEKVFYKLGNPKNKGLRGELISILASDPSGLKLATFLGEQKALLSNSTKRRISKAPIPDDQLNGDESSTNKERVLKKQYQTAHKKGDGSAAWKARRAAKKLKIDVSKW